jgi:hypothetical protein
MDLLERLEKATGENREQGALRLLLLGFLLVGILFGFMLGVIVGAAL